MLAWTGVCVAENDRRPTLVDTLVQNENESPKDFLRRVAATFRDHTKATGHEVGGYLCSNPKGRLGLFMATSKEPMYVQPIFGCPLQTPDMEQDFIHSHPEPGFRVARVIRNNQAAMKAPPRKRLSYISAAGQRRFSTSDYALGNGYVVAGRYVIHQRGRGTECLVADLENQLASPVRVDRLGKILKDQPCEAPPFLSRTGIIPLDGEALVSHLPEQEDG